MQFLGGSNFRLLKFRGGALYAESTSTVLSTRAPSIATVYGTNHSLVWESPA